MLWRCYDDSVFSARQTQRSELDQANDAVCMYYMLCGTHCTRTDVIRLSIKFVIASLPFRVPAPTPFAVVVLPVKRHVHSRQVAWILCSAQCHVNDISSFPAATTKHTIHPPLAYHFAAGPLVVFFFAVLKLCVLRSARYTIGCVYD